MADIKSTLIMNEMVENTERKFGSNEAYFPCYVETPEDVLVAALFTEDQIRIAIQRAERNTEDISPNKEGGLFDWLF